MITFSGIDCSGKSTQIDIIKEYLAQQGKQVEVIWSRGGYTPWVEGFKTLIRRDKNYTEEQKKAYREAVSNSSFKSKLLLFASIWDLARYYGITFRWKDRGNRLVVCDRYIWDTLIDFKVKFPGIDFEKWFCWKFMVRVIKKPSHSFIFTIPAEESMRRSDLKNDLHPEPYDVRVFRINCYMEQIEKGRWSHVIDATVPIEEVSAQVKEILNESSSI